MAPGPDTSYKTQKILGEKENLISKVSNMVRFNKTNKQKPRQDMQETKSMIHSKEKNTLGFLDYTTVLKITI